MPSSYSGGGRWEHLPVWPLHRLRPTGETAFYRFWILLSVTSRVFASRGQKSSSASLISWWIMQWIWWSKTYQSILSTLSSLTSRKSSLLAEYQVFSSITNTTKWFQPKIPKNSSGKLPKIVTMKGWSLKILIITTDPLLLWGWSSKKLKNMSAHMNIGTSWSPKGRPSMSAAVYWRSTEASKISVLWLRWRLSGPRDEQLYFVA